MASETRISTETVPADVVCDGGSTKTCGIGVGVLVIVGVGVRVAVDVLVAVAVAVGVDVKVGVGVAVNVGVAVLVGVGVDVKVGVAVLVGVGVAVLVAVKVGVAVGVLVGVAVFVGVAVAVAVAVAVNVGVAVFVGVDVNVGVCVAVGETKVIEPFAVVGVDGEPMVSSSATAESVAGDVPSATVENWMVVRMPAPFGPALAPVVVQPNVTLFAPVVGAGQLTVRVVEPRKAPLVALTNESTPASHVSVKS